MANREKKEEKEESGRAEEEEEVTVTLSYEPKLQLYLTRSWGTTNISIICCEQVKCRIRHQIQHDTHAHTHTRIEIHICMHPNQHNSFQQNKNKSSNKMVGLSLFTQKSVQKCESSLDFWAALSSSELDITHILSDKWHAIILHSKMHILSLARTLSLRNCVCTSQWSGYTESTTQSATRHTAWELCVNWAKI